MNNKLMGWRIDRERQERATLAAQASYVNACAVADDLRGQRDRAEAQVMALHEKAANAEAETARLQERLAFCESLLPFDLVKAYQQGLDERFGTQQKGSQ